MIYKMIISGRLPGLNEYINACRSNPYRGATMKQRAERSVINAALVQLKKTKIKKPVTMSYLWVEQDRRRDMDNVSSFGRKVIQDGLVKSGILRNDGWKEIKGFSDPFAVDHHRPRIEVTITEL